MNKGIYSKKEMEMTDTIMGGLVALFIFGFVAGFVVAVVVFKIQI